MMKLLLTFGFLSFCSAANGNAFARLFDDLFEDAGYDTRIIPMEKPPTGNGDNAINLGLGLSLINIGLDQVGNMDVNAWLRASWKDYRLMWDPAQYEGIKTIRVPAQDIWRPDISVYNEISYGTSDLGDALVGSTYQAVVTNDGNVIWIPPVHFEVGCNGKGDDAKMITLEDLDDPVDCHIVLGSWVYDAHHLNITTFTTGHGIKDEELDLSEFSLNSAYIVESQEEGSIQTKFYDCCVEPYMSVDYRFKVKMAYTVDEDGKQYRIDAEDVKKIITEQRKDSQTVF